MYFSLFIISSFTFLCTASTLDAPEGVPRLDHDVDPWYPRNPWNPWPMYPRKHPRRPPPPFDSILRPYRPYPPPVWPAASTTTSKPASAMDAAAMAVTPSNVKASRTEDNSIVLYKIDCDPCMPGWGVKSLCNRTSQTICTPCPIGLWTPRIHHYRPCMLCSKCGPGLYEEFPCTSIRDTKCDSCTNPNAKINEDFVRKCGFREDVFDVRVSEWKLNADNMGKSDASPEFDSNEDGDLDQVLTGKPDEDMEDEDPLGIPDILRDETPNPNKDDAIIATTPFGSPMQWQRVMGLREEADREVADISGKLQAEHDQVQIGSSPAPQQPRRLFLRPLPQRMPIPGPEIMDVPEQPLHLDDDVIRPDSPPENNYPPSYHGYSIDSLLHAGEGQRRKAIVLLILVCAIVLSTVGFIVCYVREYCRRRRSANYNRVLVVNLSPEEREIIRQSAQVLETLEKPTKKHHVKSNGYSQIINAESQTSVAITDNPLESYLNTVDEGKLQKEPLVDNEVANIHRQHSLNA